MRSLFLAIVLVVVIAGVASADPGKPRSVEDGETVETAIEIVAIPYEVFGSTTNFIDDYDEVCPYTGSLSPDIVYAYTPPADGLIDIDLCESGYDTKVFIYENAATPGAPYACNDDADCALSYRSALLGVSMTGGNTYYIVIDGYGSDMGDFQMTITQSAPPSPPCSLECPSGGVAEGEPTLLDEYIDNYNGGCNSDVYVFQSMDFPVMCGISGWYSVGGSGLRDTDWFSSIADAGGYITAAAHAEYDMYLYIMLPPDCNSTAVVYSATCQCELPGGVEFAHPAGTEFWVVCLPTEFSGPVYEFDYVLQLTGIFTGAVPAREASWGEMKTMFK